MPGTAVITYIGRLDEQKGLVILLKAFSALLQKTQQPVQLLIAGHSVLSQSGSKHGTYQKYLKELASDLNLSNNVRFLGHLDHPVFLYQISDLTVLPSLYPEPFGRTIIESMACGVPAIASNLGGIPEILTDEFDKGLFEPGSFNSLAQKLLAWINWRSQDPGFGMRCRHHVATHFPVSMTLSSVEKSMLSLL